MALPIVELSITRDYLMTQRQALLLQLEAIELLLAMSPRTSELRKAAKNPPPQYQCELEYEKKNPD